MANAERTVSAEAAIRTILTTGLYKSGKPVVEDLHRVAYSLGQLVTGTDNVSNALVLTRLREAAEKRGFDLEAIGGIEQSVETGMLAPRSIADLLKAKAPANDNKPGVEDDTIDAMSLLAMDFPPISYVIPGYVVEGLTVLGGKPKLGKSWLAYDWVIAVATGGRAMGQVECEQGDALYLALEDNRRRVKDRINIVRPLSKKLGGLERLMIRTTAPRIDTGLLDEIEKWRASVVNPRLVVIDVWMKIRPPRKRNEDAYAADYAAVQPLQQYAGEKRLAIVLVTHTRKMEAEDPLEAISGTNGVTGAADAILVLNRNAKGTTLYGRGRDIEEIDSAMKFDGGRWSLLGDADEVRKSSERRRILTALKDAYAPLGPKEIAEATGLKVANVRVLLRTMLAAGEIQQPEYGFYKPLIPITPITPDEE